MSRKMVRHSIAPGIVGGNGALKEREGFVVENQQTDLEGRGGVGGVKGVGKRESVGRGVNGVGVKEERVDKAEEDVRRQEGPRKSVGVSKRQSIGRRKSSIGGGLVRRMKRRGRRGKLYQDIDANLCEEERLQLLIEQILTISYAWADKNEKRNIDMDLVERATENVLAYVIECIVEEGKSMGGIRGMKRVNPRTLELKREEVVLRRTIEELKREEEKWKSIVLSNEEEKDCVDEDLQKVDEVQVENKMDCSVQKELYEHRKKQQREELC